MIWVSPNMTSFQLLSNPKGAWNRERGFCHSREGTRWKAGAFPNAHLLTWHPGSWTLWDGNHVTMWTSISKHTAPSSAELWALLGNPFARLQPAPYFSPQSIYFLLLPFSSSCKLTEEAACLHSPFTFLPSSVHHGLLITLRNLQLWRPFPVLLRPLRLPQVLCSEVTTVRSLPLCSHSSL